MKIPNYDIKRVIGKGGMATVYLAVQESLEREVALKVMSSNLTLDEGFSQRFYKEGKLIAQLKNPYILDVYDIGSFENYYYMALQYAPAGNLASRIEQGLTPRQSLDLLKKIAIPLGYAHSKGIIHRDIKPDNILFQDDHTPLLSDFGIAKALADSAHLTQVGATIGTPLYMSPEQLSGDTVSAQTDLYSLGIVFYEMLTGQCPHEGNTYGIIYKRLNDPLPILPGHHGHFQPILERLLAKNPADRFASADELIEAIERIGVDDFNSDTVAPHPSAENAKSQVTAEDRTTDITIVPFTKRSPQADVATTAVEVPEARPSTAPHELPTEAVTTSAKITSPDITAPEIAPAKPPQSIKKFVGLGALLVSVLIGGGLYQYYQSVDGKKDFEIPQHSFKIRDPEDFIRQRLAHLEEVAEAYRRVLRIDETNTSARAGFSDIADRFERLARLSWNDLDKQLSLQIVAQGLELVPQHKGLLELKQEIDAADSSAEPSSVSQAQIESWLQQAEGHLAAARYTYPSGNNAVELYRKVLQHDPDNKKALQRLDEIAAFFAEAAREEFSKGNVRQAITRIEQGLMVNPKNAGLLALKEAAEQKADKRSKP